MAVTSQPDVLPPVAVVGAGLVGAGWAIVFARAGYPVRVYDENAKIRDSVMALIAGNLKDLKSFHLIAESPEQVLGRITVQADLAEAMSGVAYVQESVFETVAVKTKVYAALDLAVPPHVPIGSSSSGIPASAFTENCKTRARMMIAHPVNPPYLVPLVELVPAPWTDSNQVDAVFDLMKAVGQEPIRITKEVEGFVLNRLQGALLNEAWALFKEGYASAEDIDKTVAAGLGLRWSFMGPFETIDLNAPAGVADYAQRLGPLYHSVAQSRRDPKAWDPNLIEKVEAERRTHLKAEDLDARRAWRDRRLMALIASKAKAAKDLGS
ncbi:MAG: 3-hydroxyacyl-CoA dehydrogenase [Rhodospirillaceae bacterium]|nr:3-hydroxyacyl-CoA dehydrogenase [Rhodospirillaceae bacterium]